MVPEPLFGYLCSYSKKWRKVSKLSIGQLKSVAIKVGRRNTKDFSRTCCNSRNPKIDDREKGRKYFRDFSLKRSRYDMHTGVLEQEKSIHEKRFYFELCENSSSYLWIGDWVCRQIKNRQFVLPISQPLIPKMAYYAKYHRRFRGGLIRKLHDDDQEEEEGENHQV